MTPFFYLQSFPYSCFCLVQKFHFAVFIFFLHFLIVFIQLRVQFKMCEGVLYHFHASFFTILFIILSLFYLRFVMGALPPRSRLQLFPNCKFHDPFMLYALHVYTCKMYIDIFSIHENVLYSSNINAFATMQSEFETKLRPCI